MDIRLQVDFGTWRTFVKVREDDILTSPIPAIGERDPPASLMLLFPTQGLYEKKRLE